MKNKVLAVLLAVCMIAGSCVLFASAAPTTFEAGTYVVTKSGADITDTTKFEDLKLATVTDIKVTAKASPTAAAMATEVTASNVESLCDFSPAFSSIKNDVEVSGTISDSSASVTVKPTAKIYKVLATISGEANELVGKDNFGKVDKYTINGKPQDTITVNSVKKVVKLCSLTMGVRFFGDKYENLVAAEIAKVDATVTRNGNTTLTQKVTTSVSNVIKDLMPGDTVDLKASLKDASEKDYYGFYCWVDANGNVQSTNDSITITMDGNDVAIYATFVELKNRHTISYSISDNGKVLYEEAREVFDGVGQVSVMEGRNATFDFIPDEGYEISKVVVNGKNITSLKSIDLDAILKGDLSSLRHIFRDTGKNPLSFTFEKVIMDQSIEVYFAPIENFEAPSGLDMPTVEPEGITLATGADNSSGGNGGSDGTTVPGEDGAAGSGSAVGGVVNPATGSTGAIAVFAALSVAAAAAFVTAKKKED